MEVDLATYMYLPILSPTWSSHIFKPVSKTFLRDYIAEEDCFIHDDGLNRL